MVTAMVPMPMRTLLCAAMAAFGSMCSGASAQDAEEAFFKGKTARLIVGYSSGGGYDLYARMIAPYIGKALGATIVVENQPQE